MNTKQTPFSTGSLLWSVDTMTAKEFTHLHLNSDWHDGFAAFSNAECRLRELGSPKHLAELLDGRIENHDGLEGFLMEGGLWRSDAKTQVYEELALEREGNRYFVQYWRLSLHKSTEQGSSRCYWRDAATFARGNLHKLFPEKTIAAFEVIVPADRLRFYITRGQ